MIDINLKGMGVAFITPFKEDDSVDYEALGRLVDYLIHNGADYLVVLGTTAETPTLTEDEKNAIIKLVVEKVNRRIPIVLGVGGNCTWAIVEKLKNDNFEGIDAILSVCPYYNKPSQRGMIEHFSAVAEASDLPVILYNIPSRTGVNMLPETVAFLAEKYPNIVALKQSSPDMDLISELKLKCPADFAIYSGDDSLTLPMLSLGVHGVISVASHIFGKELKSMIRNFKTGEVLASRNMHKTLFPVFKKLFMAPNPVPVKAALKHMGLIEDYVRRPLVELDDAQKAELFAVIDDVKRELAG